ncbi:hypothetical protein CTEN210_06437 [Chaetoceros tenuissimus]|uniref:RING-type E3 ubiquitin transferase n=1 Tax=Chaetoceros tenuissimus TaxID=426638 RepID=A0AAD3CPU2_9STRA|nr:hypothetical protein CTEN210_06437 [Chaetoceros tenuissimus]
MNEYTYETNDLLDALEKVYYEAKALKNKNRYQEAIGQFKLLIEIDQCYSTVSISIVKFKSLKQLIKMKINQGEYHGAATLFRQLLDDISTNNVWNPDYTISSIEKMLDRIFSLAPSHQGDLNEKKQILTFARNIHEKAINMFHPFGQSERCCPNGKLWLHAHVKYSHFLFRLEEEQRLKELEDAIALSISRTSFGVLVYFMETLLLRLHKEETLLCTDSYQQKKIVSFVQIYEEKKIELSRILSNFMHEMGSVHQHAGELYMTSSNYDKAHSSLIEACICWKQTSDYHAHVYCVKLLYTVKMLQGSAYIIGEDVLRDISPSEAYAIATVFDAFRSNNIEVFEKYMEEIDDECVVMKEGILKIHRELQKRILLKELRETSRFQLSDLSSKLNGLGLTSVTSLVMGLIAEKKLRGQVRYSYYEGSLCPYCHVAESIHVAPVFSSIQTQPSRHITESSASNDDESQANIQVKNVTRWPNPDEDYIVDVASLLVEAIVNNIQRARTKYPHFARHIDVTSLDFDELGQQLIRFLHQHAEFKARNVSSFIDIGYHYTKPSCAGSIRSTGLKCSVQGTFGPGIYTGNNCKAFANRGSVGLIVLRLQGKTTSTVFDAYSYPYGEGHMEKSFNTVLGNQHQHKGDHYKEVVLQSSSQCVPIIIFDAPCSNPFDGRCLNYIHKSLQRMIDGFLNTGSVLTGPNAGITEYLNNLPTAKTIRFEKYILYTYTAPYHLVDGAFMHKLGSIPLWRYDFKQDCPICLGELGSNPYILRSLHCACVHISHQGCIQKSLEMYPRCPTCKKWVKEPQGNSPSGTMCISIIPDKCSGYSVDTIVIHYQMDSGYQKSYHPNPNAYHDGNDVKAYLPNNDDGMKLLKRLKYAFEHGLIFTVGTSMTTGRKNQCTWASIHHKTSLSGGTFGHGYPDVSYFMNCNDELDGLGVPPADDIRL